MKPGVGSPFFDAAATAGENTLTWNYLDSTLPTGISEPIGALYQFDGTADSLTDRGPNGYDLSLLEGSTLYTRYRGIVGLAFTGNDSYIRNNPSLLRTGGFADDHQVTVEAVVLLVTENGQHWIMGMGAPGVASTSNAMYSLYTLSSQNNYRCFYERGASNDSYVVFNAICPAGLVQYVAFSRNTAGTSAVLNQNGRTVSSITGLNPPSSGIIGDTQDLYVGSGCKSVGGSEEWSGIIFSIRITLEQFTEAQMLESYNRVRGIS
jgi:hypothetical protein